MIRKNNRSDKGINWQELLCCILSLGIIVGTLLKIGQLIGLLLK